MTARRLLRSTGGMSAVEFAMIAAPLMLMIVGTIEATLAIWERNSLQQVAISGARCVGLKATACVDTATSTYDEAKTKTHLIALAAKWGVAIAPADAVITAAATCQGLTGFAQVSLRSDFQSSVLTLAGAPEMQFTATACFPNQS